MSIKLSHLLAQHIDLFDDTGDHAAETGATVSAGNIPSPLSHAANVPAGGPLVFASHVDYLESIPPVAVFAQAGSEVSLNSILASMFGSYLNSYAGFQLAYYGAQTLQDWDFKYWNPSDPQVARWFVDGIDIGPAGDNFSHRATISASDIANTSLVAGNNISNFAFIEVPVAYNALGEVTELQEFSVVVVDPAFAVDTHGAPTPHDVVQSALHFANVYSGMLNDNDCDKIACALTSAIGAALNIDAGDSTDPTQNLDGGFWRVAYRGSDPGTVTDWQTLVHPGDVVRMGWEGGGHHTTTVLAVNPNGSIRVFDNDAYNSHGQEIMGVHNAYYELNTDPTTITIYRLSPDHLYSILGGERGETLVGTEFNDKISGFKGADTLLGGVGNDVLLGGHGADTLAGGSGADRLFGSGGADHIDGGSGADILHYATAADSSGAQFDVVSGFNFKQDTFDLWFTVVGVDVTVDAAAIRKTHFNHDLSDALSSHLAANDAVLVKVAGGHYAGDVFLVVDANGTAGYQAGEDLVIRLAHASHLGALNQSDFT